MSFRLSWDSDYGLRYRLVFAVAACFAAGGTYASGGAQDSIFTLGQFTHAVAFSIDPDGNFFVLDAGTSSVLKVSPGGEIRSSIGGYGWSDVSFDRPADLAVSNGLDVYVADYGNHRVQRFDRSLSFVATLSGKDENGSISFGYPRSVAVSRSGTLYIADGENVRIVAVNVLENRSWSFGGTEAREGKLSDPRRIRIVDENVFVQEQNFIKIYDIFGNFVRTVKDSVLRDVTGFAVADSLIWFLDACSVRTYTLDGQQRGAYALPLKEKCSDIAARNERVYVLTENRILRFPVNRFIR